MGWDNNCGNVNTDIVVIKCHLMVEINLSIAAAPEQRVVIKNDKFRLIGKI